MDDTIVAISTCVRPAPRAILRLSGDRSEALASAVFDPGGEVVLSQMGPYSSAAGTLHCQGAPGALPTTLYVFRSPKSYTREDVLEIHLPGSLPLAEMLLEDLLQRGARMAEPGEFTRRAFENGRVDLAEVEAVLALISSHDRAQAAAAIRQIGGSLSRAIKEVSEQLVDLLSLAELSIDFSEEDVPILSERDLASRAGEIGSRIRDIMNDSSGSEVLSGAVRVALLGAANAGKSSLLNALLAHERAIVAPLPGTTRDAIEAHIEIEGIPFVLVDLAGKLDEGDALQQRSWEMALHESGSAQINLLVYDASVGFSETDIGILSHVDPSATFLIANKTDIAAAAPPRGVGETAFFLAVSALTGEGIDALRRALADCVRTGRHAQESPVFLLSARQRGQLLRAREVCRRIAQRCEEDLLTIDMAADDLQEAIRSLGELTGAAVSESVLERIFNQFCIGK